jgi:hypothetical protein
VQSPLLRANDLFVSSAYEMLLFPRAARLIEIEKLVVNYDVLTTLHLLIASGALDGKHRQNLHFLCMRQ